MRPNLSIVIVNYNTTHHLRLCLESIKKELGFDSIEVLIVDNNSTDRSIEELAVELPRVRFFMRECNDGFAAGCNYGAGKATGKCLLFLNPDIIINDNSLLNLLSMLEDNESAGIVSGMMCNERGEPIYFYNDFPSVKWEIIQLVGKGFKREIDRLNFRKEISEEVPFEVDWFHGAFFMMRKSDFEEAGRFDESYFMYYEDVELCFRMKARFRKKNICDPSVRYTHFTRSSIASESNDNIYTFHINRGKLIFIENYSFLRKSMIYTVGLLNVISRIIILPFWSKYRNRKPEKFIQLTNVLKLYLSKNFLSASKFKYINA